MARRLAGFALIYGLYVLLAGLVVLFTIISNSFLTIDNWIQISIAACFLLAAAAGLTLVLITGNIDLTVGSIAYLAAATVYLAADYPTGLSILAALAVGLAAGCLNGVLVAYLRMNALLTTLGLLIAYRGISLVLTGGTVHPVGHGIKALGSIKLFDTLPLVFLVSLVVMAVLQIIARHTRLRALLLRHWQQSGGRSPHRHPRASGDRRRICHLRCLRRCLRHPACHVSGRGHHLHWPRYGISGGSRRGYRRHQPVRRSRQRPARHARRRTLAGDHQ